jgi:uncharacterized repeat protein (TIGR03806 family)
MEYTTKTGRPPFFTYSVCFCLCFFLLSACGGGGGSGNNNGGQTGSGTPPTPNTPPFGLTQRQSLAAVNLPLTGTNLGTYTLTNAFPNLSFNAALFATGVPGTNRLAVLEQGGRILAFTASPGVATTQVVLDLSARVLFAGEQGLLGLAFDPDFTQNRYFYIHYSVSNPRRSVIARFTWNATTDQADINSEKIILEIDQPYSNHNGGMLAFGPDGYLYIAMGDGGSGGDPQNFAQNQMSLLGKLLRINAHPQNPAAAYDIPLDNPFSNDPNVRDEIYASGLRNPFRFSFDRQTGELWLADVGQNEIEEINIITSGGNYGWRVFEGTQPYDNSGNTLPNSAFTPPVYEYDHSEGVSVIGGYVYRGTRLASLLGRYLYSDFGSGTVWALAWDGTQVTGRDTLARASSPTSFGETNSGELLVVSRNNGLFELNENGGGGGQLPTLLSMTGIFDNLSNLTPASGLIEYTPNLPFWSDGVNKRRWVGIPDSQQISFAGDDLVFPTGTITVKHFEVELTKGDPSTTKRLETRVFINSATQGWQGFTYRWNANGTDATLLTGRETELLTRMVSGGASQNQLYEYPSRTDCLVCHAEAAGFTLGLKTPQLNGDFDYQGVVDNQLRSWNNINLFTADIGDADQYDKFPDLQDSAIAIEQRARGYLDVNCSNCHRPGGPAPTSLDLRFEVANTNLNAIDVAPAAGNLGVANAAIIAAGERQRSVLWLRMQRLDGQRMPPISSHVVDSAAVDLIGTWIDQL